MRIPTYESHQQISGLNAPSMGGAAGAAGEASAFANAAGLQRARGLERLAAGLDKLNDAVTAEAIRERRERLELDLLKDMQDYRQAGDAFYAEYVANSRAPAGDVFTFAGNAASAAAAFHQERQTALYEKYAHNPAALRYLDKHAPALAAQSAAALADHGRAQESAYKDEVYQGELAQAKTQLADWRLPAEKRRAVIDDIRRKTIGFHPGDPESLARLEAVIKEADAARWQNRLADARQNDPEQAIRLARAALALKTLDDEASQVEVGLRPTPRKGAAAPLTRAFGDILLL